MLLDYEEFYKPPPEVPQHGMWAPTFEEWADQKYPNGDVKCIHLGKTRCRVCDHERRTYARERHQRNLPVWMQCSGECSTVVEIPEGGTWEQYCDRCSRVDRHGRLVVAEKPLPSESDRSATEIQAVDLLDFIEKLPAKDLVAARSFGASIADDEAWAAAAQCTSAPAFFRRSSSASGMTLTGFSGMPATPATDLPAVFPGIAKVLGKFQADINAKNYPHKCPKCGAPAYVGFAKIECSVGCCA